ncbi:hypothetical protein [Chitinophaga sp. XS-30]|uniref:hypothetical protein n=1 Tax=Chitinophaga sp. XS-30 TaxID=2604421 RepID=UPI0011DE1C4C|nr:hypothetical protein [Chitinophaga sp. XS-30]QEH42279.1 hypothetical protein FW415_15940 [Chitinophaga sp. XS-30]
MHTFHIPVMGLAYTIDSPIKVARFGISSVISIIEDRLIEMMRSHYYRQRNEPYLPISSKEDDYRAKRITDYLNLVNRIVQEQMEKLRHAAFEAGSEIVKYFEMLPEDNLAKQLYLQLVGSEDNTNRASIEKKLRESIQAGSIDVNIMTKTDRQHYGKDGAVLEDGSDAVAALRGYANSDLTGSSIIFSAGMNPRLYNYLEKCRQFDADEQGQFNKKIVIKVSDYRSALIQGKYLAKKGIWVSEFRVESGLNCGGHAFATDGYLMGPILEEFRIMKQELINTLFELYSGALAKRGATVPATPPPLKISAQGGIGTAAEDRLLHTYYELDSTGWGTPFLLVPEATTVDAETLQHLCAAQKDDVVLSHQSPMGVRFHYLKGLSGEAERLQRIRSGKPGSPCTEKHLSFNTEFTAQPICTASIQYQRLKIAQLKSSNLPEPEYRKQMNTVLDKECLCTGLSNSAAIAYNTTMVKNQRAVTICPGPNIAYFNKAVSLQQMTDHIYGRASVITDTQRPHMFIAELRLYIQYLNEQRQAAVPTAQTQKSHTAFCTNLLEGISYYRGLHQEGIIPDKRFPDMLDEAEAQIRAMC